MTNPIYATLSKQTVLENQMQVIANNLANMSTPGFRAHNSVFINHVAKNSNAPDTTDNHPLTMVQQYGDYMNTESGTIKMTGNNLDVALEGPGFLGVVTNDGVQYTRSGSFRLDNTGQLTTTNGRPVANVSGGPINIPEDARAVIIAKDGTISTDEGDIGQLMVVEFENVQTLEAQGNGLYKTDSPATQSINTVVTQGALEGANVNPIIEVTRMIEVSRSYQSAQSLIETEHERQKAMIQRLSRAR
jgi:flagellar basal-body rod protein FlgF